MSLPAELLFTSGSADLTDGRRAACSPTSRRTCARRTMRPTRSSSRATPTASRSAARSPSAIRPTGNWPERAPRASCARSRHAGVDGARLAAVSRGEKQPVAPDDSPEGRAANRRIEIRLIPLPGTTAGDCASPAPGARRRRNRDSRSEPHVKSGARARLAAIFRAALAAVDAEMPRAARAASRRRTARDRGPRGGAERAARRARRGQGGRRDGGGLSKPWRRIASSRDSPSPRTDMGARSRASRCASRATRCPMRAAKRPRARAARAGVRRSAPDDVLLVLLSGGASALLACPQPGLDARRGRGRRPPRCSPPARTSANSTRSASTWSRSRADASRARRRRDASRCWSSRTCSAIRST